MTKFGDSEFELPPAVFEVWDPARVEAWHRAHESLSREECPFEVCPGHGKEALDPRAVVEGK